MAESQPTPQLRSLVDSAQRAIADAANKKTFDLPYAAPDHRPNPVVETLDKIRVGVFGVTGLLLLLTSLLLSSGSSGRFQASYLDTSVVHSYIWPIIAASFIGSAIFSAMPQQLAARRQRAVMFYSTSAVALMACALSFASGFLTMVGAVLATCSTLLALYAVQVLNRMTARNYAERLGTDIPLSFFAGFSMVYSLQLWFAALGWVDADHALKVSLAAVAVSIVAAVIAHSERGRHSLATGFGIGMIASAVQGWWLASTSLWVSILWAFLAIIVFICAENRRFQISHAEHRAQSGRELDF